MSRMRRHEGRNKEIQLAQNVLLAAVAGGTAADFETPLAAISDLTALYPSGQKGAAPNNNVKLRTLNIVAAAVVTGSNTHNCTININQWRAGVNIATLCSYALTQGNNLAQNTPLQLVPSGNVTLQRGDVITVQRVS